MMIIITTTTIIICNDKGKNTNVNKRHRIIMVIQIKKK